MIDLQNFNVDSANVEFWTSIAGELLSCSNNFFSDNIDRVRLPGQVSLRRSIRDRLLQLATTRRVSLRPLIDPSKVQEVLSLPGLPETYSALEDDESRNLLIKLLAYRILGPRRVKLPTNCPQYWKTVEHAKRCLVKAKVIKDFPVLGALDLYAIDDLQLIGHHLTIVAFLLGQYRCERAGVSVEPGDIVVDAGGCLGDTALFFAKHAKKVFCYECIPSNIEILQKNLTLNPDRARKISVIANALHREQGKQMKFSDSGPGSRAAAEGIVVTTDTIDSLVSSGQVERVDFIKMDIEGAEMDALIGAERTIRSYRPRLAISVYHSLLDFVRIPKWIASLNLGYKFYLEHFTIHEEETILYAKSETQ